ncbi:beta-phosphoglucomutase [uncultured Sphingomonas sp.]|uniref:beta-phosphoglucomutase n=1 Tax=uncultured Sphingomonas sp. TaxID=158754 RepID=UPI0035CA7357
MAGGHQNARAVAPDTDADDPWVFSRGAPADEDAWASEASLFALADGVLGVRGGVEERPHTGGGAYLNRVYDAVPLSYPERFSGFATHTDTRLPMADGAVIDLRVGDGRVADGRMLDFWRRLDLRTGELVRYTRWQTPDGSIIDVLARRVVFGGGVLALRLEVRSVDHSGPLTVTSLLDAGGAGAAQAGDPRHGVGSGHHLATSAIGSDGDAAWLLQHGRHAGVGGAVAQAHRVERLRREEPVARSASAAITYRADLAPGEQAVFEKVVAYVPFDAGEDDQALADARARAAHHAGRGYAAAAASAARELAPFWEAAEVTIPDDAELTRAMRFNLMHLRRSAPADGRSGLAAKGLTGEGYQGHTFWDAEAFALPVLALTAPALARSNLAFRVAGLDRARRHAREMDHSTGALYPWRTIGGDEGSGYFPAGSAQYHINAAIAYAVRSYDRATGDDAFVLGAAAPMVFETARLWLAAGFHDSRADGAFRICSVTGPDEYSALVDDDHYTNRLAQLHLRYALELASRAPDAPGAPDADERVRWADAATRMHLPLDPVLGVHPQDSTFLGKPEWPWQADGGDRPLLLHYHPLTLYRHQIIKQASVVLAHAVCEVGDPAQQRRDLTYYEPRTVHDSSLSASSHAIVAARLGRTAEAWRFLRESVFIDLDNLHGNVGHGLHMASMAGGWQALACGFAGLRVVDGAPALLPRTAPELPRYAFRFAWRGAALRVEVDAGRCRYSLGAEGGPLTFTHDGLPLSLRPGESVERPTPRFGSAPTGAIRALLFDLDGVLTDTARLHYVAWQALADELGIPFDAAANEALKGVDRDGSLALILARGTRRYDDDERRALAERKNAHYQRLIADITPADLLPGARAALERARAAGLPVALASASRNARTLLDRLGIAHFFDAVVDPASVPRGKPDPAIFLAAARKLDVDPAACLGIEDSHAGLQAIRAAGMTGLGVGDPAALADADAVVANLDGVDWADPIGAGPVRA